MIIVKQGEGNIVTNDKNTLMSRLLELGGRAPFFSGNRGSYILLGYRLQRGDTIPWITQVAKVEAGGVSYLKKVITLKCKCGLIYIFVYVFLNSPNRSFVHAFLVLKTSLEQCCTKCLFNVFCTLWMSKRRLKNVFCLRFFYMRYTIKIRK